jgi:Tfp pilus assembly protein PilN
VSQQINLYNPIFLKQKPYFSAVAMLQALALVTSGSLAIYAYEAKQNRTLARVLADTEQQVLARRDQMVAFSKQFSEQGASRALLADVQSTEARLQERKALLDDVHTGAGGDTQGYSRYLRGLARQNVQGLWLTGAEIGGKANQIVIKGRALDSALVPTYIRALNREEPFTGRTVSELRLAAKTEAPPPPAAAGASRTPARYIEFFLSIPLRGDS